MENITIINPFEAGNTLCILNFVHGSYGVVCYYEHSTDYAGLLDCFGAWARDNAPGYIETAETVIQEEETEGEGWMQEKYFPCNGGEYYLNEYPVNIETEAYTLEMRLDNCITGAMRPDISGPFDVYEIEMNNGEMVYERTDYFDKDHYIENDGDTIVITLHKDVYLAYLTMPGYMDRTEYTIHDTIQEAAEYLIDTYGDEY